MRMILAVGALALLAAPTAGIAQVVTAMTPDNFEAWLDRQRAAIQRADQAAARQRQRVAQGQQPGG